ncbi:GTP cyclohydrolase II [Rhodovibrionaceae bacterium A322]
MIDFFANNPLVPGERTVDPAVARVVDRAISDLRRDLPVRLVDAKGKAYLILAADSLAQPNLSDLMEMGAGSAALLLTNRRTAFLGLESDDPVLAFDLTDVSAETALKLANPTIGLEDQAGKLPPRVYLTPGAMEAAIALAKSARLLPAMIMVRDDDVARPTLLSVTEKQVVHYRERASQSLTRVADARVPLFDSEHTRIIAFRPADGGREHLAIQVGELREGLPPLIRLHSECYTGDLLGSLRCDCGDQLRGAIQAMASEGSGLLLYLAQEGRNIGLVNKLRAYTMQDRGSDTLDANEILGHEADERLYQPAAEILRHLDVSKVRLLTNNPEKVDGLTSCGVEVVERVPHFFPANGHNETYLKTKAQRFGHHL